MNIDNRHSYALLLLSLHHEHVNYYASLYVKWTHLFIRNIPVHVDLIHMYSSAPTSGVHLYPGTTLNQTDPTQPSDQILNI